MKRFGWVLPRLSLNLFPTSHRRNVNRRACRAEVLEVRALMDGTLPELIAEGTGPEDTSVGDVDSTDPNIEVLAFQTFGGVAPAISSFSSREEFGEYLLERALQRYEFLFGQAAFWHYGPVYDMAAGGDVVRVAAMEQVDHSETNVQVIGVDEGDLIENDGENLYVLNGYDLLIMKAYPSGEMQELSRTRFDGYAIAEYLDGDRLTVISQEYGYGGGGFSGGIFATSIRFAPSVITTVVSTFDVSNPAKPTLEKQTRLDGHYVDSRAFNSQIHVITSNDLSLPEPEFDGTTMVEDPWYPPFGGSISFGGTSSIRLSDGITLEGDQNSSDWMPRPVEVPKYESRESYVARVRANLDSLIDATLPRYESLVANGLAANGAISEFESIMRVAGIDSDSLLSIVSIDTRDSQPGLESSSSVIANWVSGVHANSEHLFVFSADYSSGMSQTRILEFSWANNEHPIELIGSGFVDGTLLNPFSADEHDGRLRIATSTFQFDSETGDFSQSNKLTIFENLDGVLTPVGAVDSFADGERIYSVRFDGDRAFVVTFRQIDPLFVFDLSNPTAPIITGELKVPGYSSYLQVIDENHLLAVGRSTDAQAVKVALYDISDPANPVEVDEDILPSWTWSLAEWDSKAIGWFASHQTLAIPTAGYDSEGWHNELMVFRIDVSASGESAIELTGSVEDDGFIVRSAYIEDVLYTISNNSVIASEIGNPDQVISQFDFGYAPYLATLSIAPVFIETDDGASDWEYIDPPETLEEAEHALTLAAINTVTNQVRVTLLEEGGQINVALRGEELRISKLGHGRQNVSLTDAESLRIEGTSKGDRLTLDFTHANMPLLSEVIVLGGDGSDSISLAGLNRSFVSSLSLHGEDGNDVLSVAARVQQGIELIGGDGNDNLSGGSGNDTAIGGSGADDLRGNNGNDLLLGGADNDTLRGHNGDDILGGGSEHDRLYGGSGNDGMSGGEGNDSLEGELGNDTLLGDKGNDHVRGGAGKDIALGGEGNDLVDGGPGTGDTVSGGEGRNVVRDLRSEIKESFVFSADWLNLLEVTV